MSAGVAPLAETSESLYDENFDTNIKGAYFAIQKALPLLNDGASIILNTSVVDSKGTAAASAYSATRAALRSLAREHGCTGADCHTDFWEDGPHEGGRR